MTTFQNLEYHCEELLDNQKAKESSDAIRNHKQLLINKAKDKVEEWKKLLDESLAKVSQDIDAHFAKFEQQIEGQINIFEDLSQDGVSQQGVIRELLNRTTDKIQMNSNYIAYELMNNDPLNEQSVEYLSSQQLVWTE